MNNKSLTTTLRFVALVATPLCLVNSFIFSYGAKDFPEVFFQRFALAYVLTFPQAVLYVSLIKRFDHRNKS